MKKNSIQFFRGIGKREIKLFIALILVIAGIKIVQDVEKDYLNKKASAYKANYIYKK